MAKVYIMDFDGFWLVYSVMHCCFTFLLEVVCFILDCCWEMSRDHVIIKNTIITTIITTYM